MKLLARLLTAWRQLNAPAPPRCRGCNTTDPKRIAPGAQWCCLCGKPEAPPRRRDGSTLPGTVELWP